MGARLEPHVGACDLSGAGGTAVATISSLLADHVSLRVRSVDRIFLAAIGSSSPGTSRGCSATVSWSGS